MTATCKAVQLCMPWPLAVILPFGQKRILLDGPSIHQGFGAE
jgi:hypothetical protein